MMKKVCLTLPEEWVGKIKRMSAKEKRSFSYMVRKLLQKEMTALDQNGKGLNHASRF